jgi:hypothetical protein
MIQQPISLSGNGRRPPFIGFPLPRLLAPDFSAFQGSDVRIEENILFVEPVSFPCGVIGPICPVPIPKGLVHTKDKDMPDIAGPVYMRIEPNFSNGFTSGFFEEDER